MNGERKVSSHLDEGGQGKLLPRLQRTCRANLRGTVIPHFGSKPLSRRTAQTSTRESEVNRAEIQLRAHVPKHRSLQCGG